MSRVISLYYTTEGHRVELIQCCTLGARKLTRLGETAIPPYDT